MLLRRQQRTGFLHRVITGDEKWIYYDNPKHPKVWVIPGKPDPSMSKRNIHSSKIMLAIWWDQKGVVYYELLKPCGTMTGVLYGLQVICLNLWKKNDRSGTIHNNKLILLHENAKPDTAKLVKKYLKEVTWDILLQPLYSPEIASSDLYFFQSMQSALSEERFSSYFDIKKWLNEWIASKEPDFFLREILLSNTWKME